MCVGGGGAEGAGRALDHDVVLAAVISADPGYRGAGPADLEADTRVSVMYTPVLTSPGGGHTGPGDAAVAQLLSDAGRVVLVSKMGPGVIVEALDKAAGPREELYTNR